MYYITIVRLNYPKSQTQDLQIVNVGVIFLNCYMGASVAHNGIGIKRTEEEGLGNTNRAQTLRQVNMPRRTWGELSRSDSKVVLGLDVWCIDGRFGDGAMGL